MAAYQDPRLMVPGVRRPVPTHKDDQRYLDLLARDIIDLSPSAGRRAGHRWSSTAVRLYAVCNGSNRLIFAQIKLSCIYCSRIESDRRGLNVRDLVFLLVVAGYSNACTAQTSPAQIADAMAISYALPSTGVKMAIGLTLTQCASSFQAKPEISFVQTVGPNPHPEYNFVLSGRDLSSFWKNKKITIETLPNGSIKSINGGLSDQTGSVITSVVKIAASVLALEGQQTIGLTGACSPAIDADLTRVEVMSKRIIALLEQIATAPPSQIEGLKKTIDTLAAEIAHLQTNELHVDLTKELVLESNVTGGAVVWHRNDFAKWLKPDEAAARANAPVAELTLGYCIATPVPGAAKPSCDRAAIVAADRLLKTAVPLPTVSCPHDPTCATTIVLREPRRATIVAVAMGPGFMGKPIGETLKQSDLVISQWGTLGYLPLRIGIGKAVNFAMGFDENGHKVSQTWDSTARGAGLLGAASSTADAAIAVYKNVDGEQLAERKAEVDRLTTLKNYNQAKHCEAVYAAGGFNCS